MTIQTNEEFEALINRIKAPSGTGCGSKSKDRVLEIDINFNAFSQPECKRQELHAALKTASIPGITVLNGYDTDQQLSELISAVSDNTDLRGLDLSRQNVDVLSIHALHGLLQQRTEYFELNLSHIPLGDQLISILQNIKQGPFHLDMTETHPTEGSHSSTLASEIAKAAQKGITIKLHDNSFSQEDLNTITSFEFLRGSAQPLGLRSCQERISVVPTTSTTSTTTTTTSAPVVAAPPPAPKIYFALSEKTFYRNYYNRDIVPTSEEALTALKESARCRVYTTEQMAVTKGNIKIKPSSFFDGSDYPVKFKITTTTDIQLGDDIPLENHHIDAAILYHNQRSRGVLLRSRCHEEELRNVVLAAYDAYARLHTPSTSTSSGADEGAGMCSTTGGNADRRKTKASHTQAGVDRAMEFKESLTRLEYVELIKALRDYAGGWFNGGFEKGKSFKAILYEKLIEKYGTQREKDFLASKTLINKDDLLDALDIANKAIVADVTAKMTPVATAPQYK